jgi:N-acetylmuramoyl-L-alanine amidase
MRAIAARCFHTFGYHVGVRLIAAVLVWVTVAVLPAAGVGARAPVVVIDPGHNARANTGTEPIGPGSSLRKIKDGGGATGVVSGTPESMLVLNVSLRLRRLLQRAGVRVVMTRTRNDGVSMGNVARARIANRAGADLFLRVHADGSPSSSTRGTHTLYPAYRRGWTDDIFAASRRAAGAVQRAVVRRLGFPDRGLDERSDITGFNWSNRPAILVELGFLSNPTEDRMLQTQTYRRRAALGLCEGTLRFLGRSAARCGS